ncbi:MAG: glycosyltransferase family 4 protein [Balneolaceae bacterium]
MNQRVLIISYYWPPSGGAGVQRYLKFSKYLPGFDVEPFVLTVQNPTYPIRDATLAGEIPEDVQVFRSKTIEPFSLYARLRGLNDEEIKPTVELKGHHPLSRIGSWIRANLFIPDARAGWYLTAKRKAVELIRKFDIDTVITTGPPHSVHLIGRQVKREQGISWIADFRDPWSTIYYNQILPRTGFANKVDRRFEKSVLREADRIIVVTPVQADELRAIEERAYHVITNGFDPADFDNIDTAPPEAPPMLIRHIGSVGEASIPETFLNVLKKISGSADLQMEFIGHVHQRLPERVVELGIQDLIRFREYLPHNEAIEEMCRSHLLLLIIPDVGDIRHHIPGKLFEYIATGQPVLLLRPPSAKGGDSEKILSEENAGFVCQMDDPGAIENALVRIYQSVTTGHSTPGRNRPASDPGHRYSRIRLTRTLAAIISELNPHS